MKILLFILSTILLVSCNQNEELICTSNLESNESHLISLQDALAFADVFLNQTQEGQSTRGTTRILKTLELVDPNKSTRSSSRPLYYLVNYQDTVKAAFDSSADYKEPGDGGSLSGSFANVTMYYNFSR